MRCLSSRVCHSPMRCSPREYADMRCSSHEYALCAAFFKVCHNRDPPRESHYALPTAGMPICAAFIKVCQYQRLSLRSHTIMAAHRVSKPNRTCQGGVLPRRAANSEVGSRACQGGVLPRRAANSEAGSRPHGGVTCHGSSAAGMVANSAGGSGAHPRWVLDAAMATGTGQLEPLVSVVLLLSRGGYPHSRSPLRKGDGGIVGTLQVPTALTTQLQAGARAEFGGWARGTVQARTPAPHGGHPPLAVTACVRVSPSRPDSGAAWSWAVVPCGTTRGTCGGRATSSLASPKSTAKNLGGGPSRGGSRLGASP